MPNLIAALGMEAAARTEAPIIMGTAPDRLAAYSEPIQRDWLLFALFIRSYDHVEWLMRQDYASPDEWLADDEQRRRWQWKDKRGRTSGLKDPSESFKAGWADYREKYAHTPRASIEAMLTQAAEAAA